MLCYLCGKKTKAGDKRGKREKMKDQRKDAERMHLLCRCSWYTAASALPLSPGRLAGDGPNLPPLAQPQRWEK